MQRKEFLKRLGFTTLAIPMAAACANDSNDPSPDATCAVSPAETPGPFPTKSPSSLVITDIRSDRAGVNLVLNITIQNVNDGCNPLANAFVDIWHCDNNGYYSEYGGSGLQQINLQDVHFLRGRQATNADGVASFLSIFPGWYPGRAPHVHVQVFDNTGKSLLITQIAFPTNVCNTVYNSATQFYSKGIQDTSNTSDFVFADSLSNEMSVVSGNVSDGYVLTHSIKVRA
jgi:protocatechuate 3,4-dioxygenase beta subunit